MFHVEQLSPSGEATEGTEGTGKENHRVTENTEFHGEELKIWMEKAKIKAKTQTKTITKTKTTERTSPPYSQGGGRGWSLSLPQK
jgi:hypothetical protein